ncbi:MAG TPA: RNA-binding S4 domain-containing protein [Vicinamibacterales bacterium]|nr:RNA-binding S4 domain-containing protein [Vicinamibacterales bacterium]
MTQSDTTVRLDIWLDVACLYKTRSEAQRACVGGKVEVNGERVKPHRQLRVGDRIELNRPYGRKQTIVVAAVAERHVPKADAKALYTDTTPPMPEAEREMRRLERIYRASLERTHAPDKRERRQLRKFKGKE